MKLICPGVSKELEAAEEYLEVVLLLGSNDVDEGIKGIVLMSADCRSQVLRDVDRGTVLS